MDWINEAEAQHLTGKSYATIRRWINANESNRNRINEDGLINREELFKRYPFMMSSQMKSDENKKIKQDTKALELANHQTSLLSFDQQVKAQQKTIESLINKKSRLPFWLNTAYILIIAAIVWIFFCFFDYQTKQLRQSFQRELDFKNQIHSMEIQAIKDSLAKSKEKIKDLKKDSKKTSESLPLFLKYQNESER